MSVTILETLQNARINLVDNRGVGIALMIGKGQLDNAIILLDKGYSPNELIDPILEEYPYLTLAPEKQSA